MYACVSDLGRSRVGGRASKHVSKVSLLYHHCTDVASLLTDSSNVDTSQQLLAQTRWLNRKYQPCYE